MACGACSDSKFIVGFCPEKKKDSTFGLTSFHLFALPGAGLRIIAFKAKFDVVSNCSDRVVGKSGRSPLPKEEGRDSQSQLVA